MKRFKNIGFIWRIALLIGPVCLASTAIGGRKPASYVDFQVDGLLYRGQPVSGKYEAQIIGTEEGYNETMVVIPETVMNDGVEYQVTSIGERAFHYTDNPMKELTIPKTIRTIAYYAFATCEELEKINFNEGLETIGKEAFFYCTSLKELLFPETLIEIGKQAFWACEDLESISFPSSLETIGDNAFDDCPKLTSVDLSQTKVKSLRSTFYECPNIEEVKLPETLESLKIEFLGDHKTAYMNEKITSLYIPASVKEVWGAFPGCPNLKNFIVDPENKYLCSEDGILYSKDKTAIYAYPSLKGKVRFSEGLKEIGHYAFYGIRTRYSLIFPKSLQKIGSSPFEYSFGVESLTFLSPNPPESLYGWYDWCWIDGSKFDYQIYVPAESLESYKWAEGWEYARDHLLPIEDVGVEAVADGPEDEYADIYTLTGVLMQSNVKVSELNRLLPPGLYIRVSPSGTSKILIR